MKSNEDTWAVGSSRLHSTHAHFARLSQLYDNTRARGAGGEAAPRDSELDRMVELRHRLVDSHGEAPFVWEEVARSCQNDTEGAEVAQKAWPVVCRVRVCNPL